MFFPSCACLIQKEIGAINAWGFDLSAACSGFLFGLETANALIISGQYNKIIVVGDTAYDYKLSSLVGADCVLVSYGHTNKKRLNNCGCLVVSSVSELFSFLKNYCLN